MHSAHGKYLEVDLASRQLTSRELPAERWEKFVGGSGLACSMLLDEADPSTVNPLGPDNTLIFMAGLFTGTGVPSACKINICARSPLTNGWGESAGSGEFGTCLRAAGFDGVVVHGRSDRPVYLLVTEERQEICDDAATLRAHGYSITDSGANDLTDTLMVKLSKQLALNVASPVAEPAG